MTTANARTPILACQAFRGMSNSCETKDKGDAGGLVRRLPRPSVCSEEEAIFSSVEDRCDRGTDADVRYAHGTVSPPIPVTSIRISGRAAVGRVRKVANMCSLYLTGVTTVRIKAPTISIRVMLSVYGRTVTTVVGRCCLNGYLMLGFYAEAFIRVEITVAIYIKAM